MDALKNQDCEYYDESFPLHKVLAPAGWLCVVWILMLVMLFAVGYMADDEPASARASLVADLKGMEVDVAARRAALAFSGVTLAITMALALTSLFWCGMSCKKKSLAFCVRILACVALFLVLSLLVSWMAATYWKPFTSELGQELLKQGSAQLDAPLAQGVPLMMFVLSCVVPSILLAGATFLLQPMGWTQAIKPLNSQVQLLLKRLRELDQMLYIGALALVFGTLQLSSGLSVALVSMPKVADPKARTDLCKTMAPSPTASSPFFAAPPASTGSASSGAFDARCQKLPELVSKLDSAESLRQFVHGITICFGLAFSALLAAIYVPSLIVLRSMLEPRQEALASKAKRGAAASAASSAVEPLSRIAAVAATLGPLFAGLLANTLASG